MWCGLHERRRWSQNAQLPGADHGAHGADTPAVVDGALTQGTTQVLDDPVSAWRLDSRGIAALTALYCFWNGSCYTPLCRQEHVLKFNKAYTIVI